MKKLAACILQLILWSAVLAQSPHPVLFEKMPPSQTGIGFGNLLRETPGFNIITYEYFYNGGGVGLADFNRDGLTDIYFTANMQPGRLYLNKGNFQFEDITQKAGVGGKRGWKTGVSIADVNADGWPDIYICYSGPLERAQRSNELYINNGNLSFSEKAGAYGVADSGYSTQAVFLDYDRDNDLDLFVVNHNNKNLRNFDAAYVKGMADPDAGDHLYRNDGGHFVNVTAAAGIIANPLGYGLGVAVSDVNNDSWPDIYVANDYVEEDYLYLNNRDGTFSETIKESLGHLSNFSMGCDIADINNDGLADIFTLDMLPEDNRRQKLLYMPDNYELYNNQVQNGFHHQLMRNMLHVNNGNGSFSEIGQASGVFCTDWSWACLFADLNNDGLKDLFVTNGYGRDMTNRDFVKFYANERLKFVRGEPSDQMFNMLQSIPVTPVHDYLYLNKNGLQFADVSEPAGFGTPTLSNGAAYADLDNDGDLDLVVNHLNAAAGIYRNQTVENGKSGSWIQLSLQGKENNVNAIGATVFLFASKEQIRLENQPVHGFQSSMLGPLHTGLPDGELDSVLVVWPDGLREVFTSVAVNKSNLLVYGKGSATVGVVKNAKPVFTPSSLNWPITHTAPVINDFKLQPLMPAMLSYSGPRLAAGDVNNDGRTDFFVGSGADSLGQIWMQNSNGNFTWSRQPALAGLGDAETTDATFFDADGDGDQDLYLVRGSFNALPGDSVLQDMLLLNNQGLFEQNTISLPVERESGSCVAVADADGDGDLDLFVGSRVVPGRYPEAGESQFLLNDGKGHFTKGAALQMGMVTDAAWADLDGDAHLELVVGAEWMPLQVWAWREGAWRNLSSRFFADTLSGWWSRVHLADMDGDGDADLVAGNWGMNSALQASKKEPLTLYYGDFDQNGSVDPLLCHYIKGKAYPMASRDELTDQMVSLRQRFPTYDSYAQATIADILTEGQLGTAKRLEADHLATSYFENNKGVFKYKPLPLQAQFSPVYAISTADLTGDGKMDILVAGNFDHARIRIGRMDAGFGALLQGDGKGGFTCQSQTVSGLNVPGCTRDLLLLPASKGGKVVFARSNAPVAVYQFGKE